MYAANRVLGRSYEYYGLPRQQPPDESIDVVDQVLLGRGLLPALRFGEIDIAFGRVDRRGVEPDLRPARGADDRADLVRKCRGQRLLEPGRVGGGLAERCVGRTGQVEPVAVPLPADRVESQALHAGPLAGPAVGASPLDDPDQEATTIPRGVPGTR